MISFDVLIPSFYRPELLAKCVKSLLSEDITELKNIIVLSHSKDTETIETLEKLKVESNKISSFVVSDIPPPGESRNKLIEKASSDFLYFIDDDAFISKDYFNLALNMMKDKSIDVFGGPDQCHDKSEAKQKILGELMKSVFVMGPTFKRHSRSHDQSMATEVELTLCNLWMKKSLFDKDNYHFDSKLKRCEENVLLEQLQEAGKKLVYNKDLFVYHFRREGLINILKIQAKSGYYRGVCFNKESKTFKWFFTIPILTGLVLLSAPLLPLPFIALLTLIHLALSTYISCKISYRLKSVISFFYSILLITLIHIGFSLGISIGTIKGLISVRN